MSGDVPIQVRTFRVIRSLSAEDIASYKAQYASLDALMLLKFGYIGHIPQSSLNYEPNNVLKRFT